MFNFKPSLSLRLRLSIWLTLGAFIVWSIATLIAWFETKREINELFDTQQILFAKRLASSDMQQLFQLHYGVPITRQSNLLTQNLDDDALGFAIFSDKGQLLLSDDKRGNQFPFVKTEGFQLTTIKEKYPWHIFWLRTHDEKFYIAVGQEQGYRNTLVNRVIFSQLAVWMVGLVCLLGLNLTIITLELRGLRRLHAMLLKRSPKDTRLISTKPLPTEIHPLINGLNHFFNRTSQMLLHERSFTSHAAHELRSPLAALRVQAEVAELSIDDPERLKQALTAMLQGIDRGSELVDQLLTLSRLDSLTQLESIQPIHWQTLLSELVSEYYFIMQQQGINIMLEYESMPSHTILGQKPLLQIMLQNVIKNSLKYSNATQLRVILQEKALVIEDDGVGVSPEELEKLGERFYRPVGQIEKGSGLGLSIVKQIAHLHHFKVALSDAYRIDNPRGHRGFRVSILFS